MELKAGDVVALKSGGHPLTVASLSGDNIECLWIGEEGDLFRETLPAIVLDRVELNGDDEDED